MDEKGLPSHTTNSLRAYQKPELNNGPSYTHCLDGVGPFLRRKLPFCTIPLLYAVGQRGGTLPRQFTRQTWTFAHSISQRSSASSLGTSSPPTTSSLASWLSTPSVPNSNALPASPPPVLEPRPPRPKQSTPATLAPRRHRPSERKESRGLSESLCLHQCSLTRNKRLAAAVIGHLSRSP
jgi:hypothetical protein